MKKIAIDLDTCMIALKTVDIASIILGYDYKEQDNKDWNFSIFPEDLRQKVFQFFDDPFIMCDHVKVIPGCQDKLEEWVHKGYSLEVVTARREKIRHKTVEMIHTKFPQISVVNFVAFDESKKEILKKINPDLFIDDAPHNILDALEIGINTTMISNKYTLYNHHLRDKVKWVKAIKDIEL